MANRDQPSSRRWSLTIRSSWPSVSRICRSRASLSWKSRSSASRTLRRCSSLARSSRISVSALASWASLSILCVSRICSRISSSRENLRASRSREAFSGSRPRRASERRNMRSSSSVIWAAAFSWVKPIVSRSETAGLRLAWPVPWPPWRPASRRRRRPSALSDFGAAGAWADAHGPGRARYSITNSPARPAARDRACGLGLVRHRTPPSYAFPGRPRWP